MLASMKSAVAHADLGPPPTCPPGTYHAYLYGHRCVPNGSHLEKNPEGGVAIVKDGQTLEAPPKSTVSRPPKQPLNLDPDDPLSGGLNFATPKSTTSAAAAPVNSAMAAPVDLVAIVPASSAPAPSPSTSAIAAPDSLANAASTPPASGGCHCGVPAAPEERLGFVVVISAALFALSRRRRLSR